MVHRHTYVFICPLSCMHHRLFLIPVVILILFAAITGCTTSAPTAIPPAAPYQVSPSAITDSGSSGRAGGTFTLRVGSLSPGAQLPSVSTCVGSSASPSVSWDQIPAGTKSLVLIIDDPDATAGTFTHWIVYNIPPVSGGLSDGQPNEKVLDDGANVGDNSAGSRGYYPPCPPIGSTHRYVFRLYAVDMVISQPTADRESIDSALSGHTLSETEFVTVFRR
jgi:Raf kinase inhibitor-like YbhB/YbcL family protein